MADSQRISLTGKTVINNLTGNDLIEKEPETEADIVSKLIFSSDDDSGEATFMSTVEALMDIDLDVAKEYFNNPSPAVTRGMPTAVEEELARIKARSKRYENVRLRSKESREALMAQPYKTIASPYSPDVPPNPATQLANTIKKSLYNSRQKQRESVG